MSRWIFDPDAARTSAATLTAVSGHLALDLTMSALSRAGSITPTATALDREVSGILAQRRSLCADLTAHADQLRGAAILAEHHESLLRSLFSTIHIPPVLSVWLRSEHWLLGQASGQLPRPTATLESAPVDDLWSLGARSVADWLTRTATLGDGQLAISLLSDHRIVVLLPGVHSLSPSVDAQDLPGAVRESIQGDSGYHEAAVEALRSLHLPSDAHITLIGHSQGGIVAMDLARDPRVRALGTVTHVVTAGSPVSNLATPAGTQVLELVNPDDLVPTLDGVAPHANPGRTVVLGAAGAITASHDLATSSGSYATLISLPGVQDRPDVRRFTTSAAAWLAGGATTTHIWRAMDGPSVRTRDQEAKR